MQCECGLHGLKQLVKSFAMNPLTSDFNNGKAPKTLIKVATLLKFLKELLI